MAIEASQGLRVLGINILGRFLANKENNVRYVALQQLIQVVDLDYNAVSRHRQIITDCLKDHDICIKKQALDLIYKITNSMNVKSITKELINYLLVADNEFRKELANKICLICEKYAPTKKWHIDTVIKVLTMSGSAVQEEYISQIITQIATTPELHSYSVAKVFRLMQENISQMGLVQLGCWLVGEFGEMLASGQAKDEDGSVVQVTGTQIIDVYDLVLDEHDRRGDRSDTIICWALTAMSKLTIRL
jgi:AP-1 complex subunit gamma-1